MSTPREWADLDDVLADADPFNLDIYRDGNDLPVHPEDIAKGHRQMEKWHGDQATKQEERNEKHGIPEREHDQAEK